MFVESKERLPTRIKSHSFIRHRITSAILEASNATIFRIVKLACGNRDLEYLFLKIKQEYRHPVFANLKKSHLSVQQGQLDKSKYHIYF